MKRPSQDDEGRSAIAAPPPKLAALRLLGRREYTSAELTDRLLAKGYPPASVDAAIAELVADGTVDDARAAAAHVRTASRVKGRGRLRILRELSVRGIEQDVARRAAGELSDEDELGAIHAFLRRRMGSSRPTLEQRRRLTNQLLRRGFKADAIRRAIESMVP